MAHETFPVSFLFLLKIIYDLKELIETREKTRHHATSDFEYATFRKAPWELR